MQNSNPKLTGHRTRAPRLARWAWITLVVNIFVILWGALVRATGSGAGCGAHWPTCDGVIVPDLSRMETVIEYTHRITSGIALLMVFAMAVWAWRTTSSGNRLRRATGWAAFLIVVEALVGAGLVLFELVGMNDSLWRAVVMGAHLANTFALLAALLWCAAAAEGWPSPRPKAQPVAAVFWGVGLIWILFIGVSGAVAALGDTLFPAASLTGAWREELSPMAHGLMRLRVWHPTLALVFTLYTSALAVLSLRRFRQFPQRAAVTICVALVGIQIGVGFINLALLAPVWMQIVHLAMADVVWLAWILAGGVVLQPAMVGRER